MLSCVRFCVTPETPACQSPLSMEFSRQEYPSGLQFPSPGDLPDPGMEPMSPALAGVFFTTVPPGKPHYMQYTIANRMSVLKIMQSYDALTATNFIGKNTALDQNMYSKFRY